MTTITPDKPHEPVSAETLRLSKRCDSLERLVQMQGHKIQELRQQLPPEDATFYERKQHPGYGSVVVLVPDPELGFTRLTSSHTCLADAIASVAAFPPYEHAEIYIRYRP